MCFRRPCLALPGSRRGWITLGFCVCGLVLILACGACAWYLYADYTASPRATVDRLNKAIANQDPALFTALVDADALAADFALAVASGMPGTDMRQTAALVQLTMLAMLKDESPPQLVRTASIPILPDNARTQFIQSPCVLDPDPAPAALCVLEHPVLGTLPLRLGLVQEGTRWRVRQILNAAELVHRYSASVQERERERHEAEIRHLEESREILAFTFPDPLCSGGVMRISGNVPLLSLSMNAGPNPGPQTVEAWGATLTLTSADGAILARPRVMVHRAIEPGSGAEGNWSQDIDEKDYLRLAGAAPLACSAYVDYVAFTNGTVYTVPPDSQSAILP